MIIGRLPFLLHLILVRILIIGKHYIESHCIEARISGRSCIFFSLAYRIWQSRHHFLMFGVLWVSVKRILRLLTIITKSIRIVVKSFALFLFANKSERNVCSHWLLLSLLVIYNWVFNISFRLFDHWLKLNEFWRPRIFDHLAAISLLYWVVNVMWNKRIMKNWFCAAFSWIFKMLFPHLYYNEMVAFIFTLTGNFILRFFFLFWK